MFSKITAFSYGVDSGPEMAASRWRKSSSILSTKIIGELSELSLICLRSRSTRNSAIDFDGFRIGEEVVSHELLIVVCSMQCIQQNNETRTKRCRLLIR